jgi:outer membrane protein assembly factor BamB
VAHWDVGAPINTKLVVGGGRVLLTDNQPRLVMLDASSLEPQGEQPLSLPAAQAPWLLGDQVFVDVGSQKLICFDAAAKLKQLWELPLGGTSVAGTPLLFGDSLLIVLQDGRVNKVDPTNGKIQEDASFDIRERIAFGPRSVGDKLLVGTLSGGLYSLDAIFRKGR